MSSGNEKAVGAESEGLTAFIGMDSAKWSLIIWLVFLVFGGGLLAMYYSRIGYVPDIAWSGLLNYLAILTLIGGAVGLLYGLLLVAPGLIWSKYLIFDQDKRLQKMLCWGEDGGSGTPCSATVLRRLVGPFAIFMLCGHGVLWASAWLSDWNLSWPFLLVIQNVFMLGVGLILTSFFFGQVMFKLGCCFEDRDDKEDCVEKFRREHVQKRLRKETKLKEDREVSGAESVDPKLWPLTIWDSWKQFHPDCRSIWLKYSLLFGLSFLVAWIALWIVFRIAAPSHLDFWANLLLLTICSFSVSLASLFFVLAYQPGKISAFLVGALFAIFLISSGEVISEDTALSSRILASFGFDSEREYSLLLAKEGREYVEGLGFSIYCTDSSGAAVWCTHGNCRKVNLPWGGVSESQDKVSSDVACQTPGGAYLTKVRVLSRLGKDVVIEIDGYQLGLPQEAVVSWMTPVEP